MNKVEIKGKGNKNILILTGIHGDELTPIYAGYLLSKYNWLESFANYFHTLTILNAVNINGIKKNTREIPSDSTTDLNRMFKNEVKEEYINSIK